MERLLRISPSPHIRDDVSVTKIMYSVNLALVPAMAGAVYFFGTRAALIIALSVLSAVATEAGIQKLRGQQITAHDGSAILTGVLLAFNLPPGVPWWMPVVGSAFAIAIGKQVFGGLGYNPMNPALLGRAFLMASWPMRMTTGWTLRPELGTISGIDGVTSATPLALLKETGEIFSKPEAYPAAKLAAAERIIGDIPSTYGHLFWGNVGGCIGETSVFLLLLGAIYLMYKGYVCWRIPFSYITTVGILSWIFGGFQGLFTGDPLFHIMAGGLVLGAFYMATDMVTSPVTPRGKLIFGTGCGALTVLIRLKGGYPEGVSYSILLMNLAVPLIDRFTKPRILGER